MCIMKKMFYLMVLILAVPLLVIAQVDSTAYPQPGSVIDIFTDLKGWLGSSTTVAGLTIFLTALVTSLVWKTATKIAKQILAVLISLALVVIGNVANIGFMAEFTIASTIIYGLVIGFMANGLYDAKNVLK